MSDPCTTNDKDVIEQIHILPGTVLKNVIKTTLPKNNRINQWISENAANESNSEISSNNNNMSSVCFSSVVDDDDDDDEELEEQFYAYTEGHTNNLDCLQNIINSTNKTQTAESVNIENSKNIHIGNVTYITGPVHVTHKTDDENNMRTSGNTVDENDEYEEMNSDSAFIGNINKKHFTSNVLTLIDRRTWLAQKPFEPYDYIQKPVKFIIISHTATEMGTTQAENIYLIRNIQCYHIESMRWNDISYNFLIGCDSNVYEGRGWGVVGAHTLGYNSKSLGISFVGCFMRELPFQVSLDACKNLIKRGIELGHISSEYKLLAHCQCRPTESPGKMLFDELKSWSNFCDDV